MIALAAAAIAMRRRRRLRIEEEEAAQYDYVEPMSHDPIFDKQPVAPAAPAAEPELVLEQTPRHDPIFDRQPAIVAPRCQPSPKPPSLKPLGLVTQPLVGIASSSKLDRAREMRPDPRQSVAVAQEAAEARSLLRAARPGSRGG